MAPNAEPHGRDSHRPSLTGATTLRPQLQRQRWADLTGVWDFAYDDADTGLNSGWQRGFEPQRAITVPFPPESPASGIGDTTFHRVLWYQRTITSDLLGVAGRGMQGDRILLHFGAVDYRCEVWVDGQSVGSHEGGHVPFSVRIDHVLAARDATDGTHTVVVRVEDDPLDTAQPRGKQDWQEHPHAVWYHRTSGIWQPVWLEAVPEIAVEHLAWSCDLTDATVRLVARLTGRPNVGSSLEVRLSHLGVPLAHGSVDADDTRVEMVLSLARQRNGQDYEHLLWSPESPRLIDAELVLSSSSGADVVGSYLGLRSVCATDGRFMLNDRPRVLRSVLSQGYWPQSHLAAPSADALREEVELIKSLGFDTARLHQKIEDPRLLYWADRLGLLVWEEMPSAFTSSTTATRRVIDEWTAAIDRDASHPCVVAWVPLNESWGVQHIAHDSSVAAYGRSLADLTRALDPSRPVISNDGWEHVGSDIVTIHDYEGDGTVLGARLSSEAAVHSLLSGIGPAGRRMIVSGDWRGRPVMLTEFGGIKFEADRSDTEAWGYTTADDAAEFAGRLACVLRAADESPVLAGWCYTQLTDTVQEKNGLLTEDRVPKLPLEQLRSLVLGD